MEAADSADSGTEATVARARSWVKGSFQQIALDALRTGSCNSGSGTSLRAEPSGSSRSFSPADKHASCYISGFRVERGKVVAVLEAWSVLNPTKRYTQGLNEVAALLLVKYRGDVSTATQTLHRLLAPGVLGGLWFAGMPLYEAGRKQLLDLAGSQVPELLERLRALGIQESAYLPQAWHSLFAKWLPLELGSLAVDDFLEHAMVAVLSITLAILTEVEKDILEVTRDFNLRAEHGAEVLLGADGYFANMRSRLQKSSGSLQVNWQSFLARADVKEAGKACLRCMDSSKMSSAAGVGDAVVTSTLAEAVQREAVISLATSSERRHNDRLRQLFRKVCSARDQAIRDELSGHHDCVFKMAIVGDAAVGKTCLMSRAGSKRPDNVEASDDLCFVSKSVKVGGQRVKLQIFETCAGRSFVSIAGFCIQEAAAVLVVYDITCRESFEGAQEWLTEVRERTREFSSLVLVLVGNKSDLSHQRQVTREESQIFAAQCQLDAFFEVSAFRGDGVEHLFKHAAESVHHVLEQADDTSSVQGVTPLLTGNVCYRCRQDTCLIQ